MLNTAATPDSSTLLDRIERIATAVGPKLTRYGIVALLLLFGALKWTPDEAKGIEPLVGHSPFWAWLYPLLGLQGTSIFFGIFELAAAISIAARPWLPLLSAYGSGFAVVMFSTTLSFLFSTPGLLTSPAGGFVMKDIVLLGASVWCLAEALRAHRTRSSSVAGRTRMTAT